MERHIRSLLSEERGFPFSSKVGKFRIAVCFPGEYAWGMSNLGYQSLLRLIFETPSWRGERFFFSFGPFSMETRTPLGAFDLLAFSLSFELDVLNLVMLLRKGGVPLFTQQRDENDPWVIAGGPLVTLNPEIVAPFVDLAFIGEAEEVFPRLLVLWGRGKEERCSRAELKSMLASLPGVYVPEGLVPVYRNGSLVKFETREGFQFPVFRQTVHLDHFETRTFLYAPSSYFKKTALIEVNRGCGYRCRFCAGGFLYAPLRQRSFRLVLDMLDRVFPWTTKVGLVGSDVLSYPHWRELVDYLIKNEKELTCSSLSGRRLIQDESLLTMLRRSGLRTLTIAPESGNCVLRKFLGKGLRNEEWKALIGQAVRVGFEKIKLYFMLGKPDGGVEEDVEFLREITEVVSPSKITVSYSFLVPKPHTPLQDFVPPPLQVWKKEKNEFEGYLRRLKIEVVGESPRFAFLELLLSRGDRLLAEKIPEVLERGGGFSLWRKALQSLKRDPGEWPRCPWVDGLRPWDMVRGTKGGETMG